VNLDGRLVMRVTATGEATALAHIIGVVQRAQNSRANIQKLADRVSNIFVPAVVLIALATALWWGLAYEQALNVGRAIEPFFWPVHFPSTALAAAFIQAAAVLIVACPCAMGLATPAAIMAGANAAAERGILIRDGIALEKSGRISSVVFDKTGTLTQGKLAVVAVAELQRDSGVQPGPKAGSDPQSRDNADGPDACPILAQLAVALAQPSNHPLSRAVVKFAGLAHPERREDSPSRRIQFSDWQELRGIGVQASLNGATLRLGSLNWLRDCGVVEQAISNRSGQNTALFRENRRSSASDSTFVAHWSAQGATILGLATENQLIGLFALRDAIKPQAANVVDRLARQGKATYLITGDHKLTAAAIAQQVGISAANVFAEIPPEQKAEIVRQLQQRGERVAFVGDGINDAPALEQADLGVAVAQASDVAREAADIILLKSDIQAIPEALGLAQATLRTIKQNLFWAFFYNAAAVPLAALGFLSPVICALAMGMSDLIVIGNALRLRRWKG